MTTEAPPRSHLIPVPPDWLVRKSAQRAVTVDRNLNDCYWAKPVHDPRRNDDGYIITGPSYVPGVGGRPVTTDAENWLRRGYRQLPVEMSYTNRVSPKTGQIETIETNEDHLNTPDRYYWLFVNGGAGYFPIEQIVERHWHLKPPYGLPKEVFPQLEEWEVPEAYWCPGCPASAPPKNSPEQVRTHLVTWHQMNTLQVRELADATNNFRDTSFAGGELNLRRRVRTDLGLSVPAEVVDLDEVLSSVNPMPTTVAKATFTPVAENSPGLNPRKPICMACGAMIEGALAEHQCPIVTDATAPQPEEADDPSAITIPPANAAPTAPAAAAPPQSPRLPRARKSRAKPKPQASAPSSE